MSKTNVLADETEDNIGSDISTNGYSNKRKQFEQMKKQCVLLCQKNKDIPIKYVEDMHDMYYHKCNDRKKNSTHLCNLIQKGNEHISSKNKNSFQYIADIYNELLQLTKKDSNNLQTENCIASTSNGTSAMTSKLENETKNDEIDEMDEIDEIDESNHSDNLFKELIDKCYENPNFPNANIKVVDELYKSLPHEFVNSKLFVSILEETNTKIWPDSSIAFYVHIEHIYDQLNQFKTSMEVQDKISIENTKISSKNTKMINELKVALKKIRKKILELDEKEMDINDDASFESDSPYILKDKYEKRALEIYKHMCKLRNEPDFLEEPKLRFKQTDNSLVNKTVEKFYNVSKTFPDYFEIYTLLKLLNEKKELNWSEKKLKSISQDAFIKLGKQLKIQRLNEYFGRLKDETSETDPAENNAELRKKLDDSNKKLYAELNEITEKFEKDQDYAEETEGSDLNNTDCENSSEDDSSNNKIKLNKELKKTIKLPVKRRKIQSDESENEIIPQKTKKSAYMKSFDLTEVTSDKIKILSNEEKTYTDSSLSKTKSINENLKINKNNSKCYNVIQGGNEFDKDNGDNVLVIDEELVDNDADKTISLSKLALAQCNTECAEPANHTIKKPFSKKIQENKVQDVKSAPNPIKSIITEPEVILNEDLAVSKDVIEICETSESDEEITEVTPKVPVHNKKSLESIIIANNFEKRFNLGQLSVQKQNSSNQSHKKNYQSQNLKNNLVNRWILNNTQPQPQPIHNNKFIRHPQQPMTNNNKRSIMNHTEQSKSKKNTTQTARQVTRCVTNSVQQQRNLTNHQSVLSRQVTTMTTTTTVRQIVQQKSSGTIQQRTNSLPSQIRNPVIPKPNGSNIPELIELD